MGRFRDFDAFDAERKGEPLTFTIRGRSYTLAPSLPAAVLPTQARVQEEVALLVAEGKLKSEDEVPLKHVFALATAILGKSNVDQLLEDNVSTAELTDILKWAAFEYAGLDQPEEGDGSGEVPPPVTGEPTSSSTSGTSSKPTSLASTP
jgi:hypothetical protein